ncbi:hypothetical protein D777_01865 [Marinobacter nitratireducens]|uniref:Uncharacterized protein n=1 Tax=Marinobacter nitratireducens TaxID=1137280 RepID=A0A072N1V7_9GAMM|nr:hypothetical protein D777_01865 [Marinobacter nitratireducens]
MDACPDTPISNSGIPEWRGCNVRRILTISDIEGRFTF